MGFKKIENGLTNVIGLSEELQSLYINNICQSNNSNVLVVTSTLYEANKLFNSISKYTDNVYLFPMDELLQVKHLSAVLN